MTNERGQEIKEGDKEKTFVQAPCRIGLFGGGTDVGQYASEYGGAVINMAINIRQKIVVGGESKLLRNDNPDFFKAFTENKIEHVNDGLIHAGLGSSAALAVCLVAAENSDLSLDEIAEEAWKTEVYKLGLFAGKQDQYAAVYGGINLFEFGDEVKREPFSEETATALSKWIILLDTGIQRRQPNIQENLRQLSTSQIRALHKIKRYTYRAKELIQTENFSKFGDLLDLSWREKKRSNPQMTNSQIDDIYERAIIMGARGGKLCGSGGGGHMIFVVDPKIQDFFIDNIGIKQVKYEPDFNGLVVKKI